MTEFDGDCCDCALVTGCPLTGGSRLSTDICKSVQARKHIIRSLVTSSEFVPARVKLAIVNAFALDVVNSDVDTASSKLGQAALEEVGE